jgi:hypothetical protein
MELLPDDTPVGHAGRLPVHDWSQWDDGKVRKAKRGVDFTEPPRTFRAAGARWAERHQKALISTIHKKTEEISFKIVPLEQKPPRKPYPTRRKAT